MVPDLDRGIDGTDPTRRDRTRVDLPNPLERMDLRGRSEVPFARRTEVAGLGTFGATMSRRLSVYLLLAALVDDRSRSPAGSRSASSRAGAELALIRGDIATAEWSTTRARLDERGGLVRRPPPRAGRAGGDRGADRRRRASAARRASPRATSPTTRSGCCSSARSPRSATTAACGWWSCFAASARRTSPSSRPPPSSSRVVPTSRARSRFRRSPRTRVRATLAAVFASDPRDVLVRDREGALLGKASPAAAGGFVFTPERGSRSGAGAGAGDRRPRLGAAGAQRAPDHRPRHEPDGARGARPLSRLDRGGRSDATARCSPR